MTYVTNPLSGRPVAVGSTVYKRLVKQGLIDDNTTDIKKPVISRMPPQRPVQLVVKRPSKPDDDFQSNDNELMNEVRRLTDKTVEKIRNAGARDDDEFDEDDLEAIKNIVIKKYNNKNRK